MEEKVISLLDDFEKSYLKAGRFNQSLKNHPQQLFNQLKAFINKQIKQPYLFEIFHQAVREPFDFYQFGLDFIRPLIDFSRSRVEGIKHFEQIRQQINRQENVILLANHQIEPDPQIISLLLEPFDPLLAESMIFIAGHRVISDPVAVPLSLGRNLLCIYSKKYIHLPGEDKEKKINHNQRTLKKMAELLNEGSCCIYVAPSGGRDRCNSFAEIELSPFDPDSIELFWLIAKQAKQLTHFYPLSLSTYHLMPPPPQIEKEVGEKREVHFTPVYLACGTEIDMKNFLNLENEDKNFKKIKRAEYIYNLVKETYKRFPL